MKFSVWFRQWVMSFLTLLTIGSKKRKSEAQRKKERARRLKAKFSSANKYRTKKKYRRRRSSLHVQNERLIGALFKFMATSLGILLLPFGLFDWGRKSAKARKARSAGTRSTNKGASHGTSSKATSSSTSSVTREPKKKESAPTHSTTIKFSTTTVESKPKDATTYTPTKITLFEEIKVEPKVVKVEPPAEPDENTPKSTPKNENDQYIRKRMIIAGSYYCDKAVLDMLEVGTRFDLEAEPDNPHDKDAVKLLYNGQKIGYIAKQDRLAFVTCLKLKRKIYGVITAIKEENGRTQYEFETWFDSSK